jgi:hypothetical protein
MSRVTRFRLMIQYSTGSLRREQSLSANALALAVFALTCKVRRFRFWPKFQHFAYKTLFKEITMTNTLKLSFLSVAFLALTATSGFAQATGHVTVKVPFAFTAGNVTLPAGDYSFQEETSGIVTISSLDTHKSVMVLTNADTNVADASEPRVKFDKVNGAYSLTAIEIAGEPGRRLVKLETATNRPASIGNRASAGAASKSLK